MMPSFGAQTSYRHTGRVSRARRSFSLRAPSTLILIIVWSLSLAVHPSRALSQTHLTPFQIELRKQASRLSSVEIEERRDALMRLGAMRQPDASRVASRALTDAAPVVRATAAHAILSLPPGEALALLVPLLSDRDEFVRRETAYALGRYGIAGGEVVRSLVNALETDKKSSVRGAAAVALGHIGARDAAPALAGALARRLPPPNFASRVTRRKVEKDEFVRRASAVALGRIGARDAVRVLVEILNDFRSPADLRREAAHSLGLIGDPSAIPSLRAALKTTDPHLAAIAAAALRSIEAAVAALNRNA